MIESLEPRQLCTATALDQSFGKAGSAHVRFSVPSGQGVRPSQLTVDSIGRTYVVADVVAPNDEAGSYQIQRLTENGKLDRSWAVGKQGRLKFVWPKQALNDVDNSTSVFRVAIDAADRLVILDGTTVCRFTSYGTADRTFGATGSVKLAKLQFAEDLIVDPTNQILVAGTTLINGKKRMAVTRLISRGKLDRSFARRGLYITPVFGPTQSTGRDTADYQSAGEYLRRLRDGTYLVAGGGQDYSSEINDVGVQVVNLTAQGLPNPKYDHDGMAESYGYAQYTLTTSSHVIGIRPDGAVATEEYNIHDDDDGAYRFNNLLLKDKRGVVTDENPFRFDATPPYRDENFVHGVDFVGPPGGPFVTLVSDDSGKKVFRQTITGRFDKAFNGGQPFKVDAIAAGIGDTIMTLSSTKIGGVLWIGRILLD